MKQKLQNEMKELIQLTDDILNNMHGIEDEKKVRKNVLKIQKANNAFLSTLEKNISQDELYRIDIYCNEQGAKMTQLLAAIQREKDAN